MIPVTEIPIEEALRHELAHLFAVRWNPLAIPLLAQGVTIWLQQRLMGLHVDRVSGYFIARGEGDIISIVEPSKFNEPGNEGRAHVLAASFCGFLIRRHGWEAFIRLYRKADRDPRRFASLFAKVVKEDIESEVERWHQEILQIEGVHLPLFEQVEQFGQG